MACGFACVSAGVAALLTVSAFALAPPRSQEIAVAREPPLTEIERSIERTYKHVRHLAPEAVAARLSGRSDLVLFDVREASEYEVSRIPGATRVNPHVLAQTFFAQHGAALAGKTVIFYCSVGVRSSRLAGRLTEGLHRLGAAKIYNLSGGIFRWHNEQNALVNSRGATSHVHPFDDGWGRYVSRPDTLSYSPMPKP